MKSNQLSLLLSASCLVLMLFTAASPGSDGNFDKVTVRKFELIDNTNTRRADIRVEETGEVVFRLFDETGTIRVKLGAGKNGSGMVLLDEATNPGLHMVSGTNGVKLTVTGKDGKKRDL